MLPNSSNIKKQAKALLGGRWPLGIGAVMLIIFFLLFVFVLFSMLYPYFTSGTPFIILSIFLVFVTLAIGFPLMLGVLKVFRAIYNNQDTDLYTVFFYFSSPTRLARAIRLCITFTIQFGIIAILLLLPSLVIEALSSGELPLFANKDMPLWFSNLWVFGAFLRTIAIAILIFLALRYYLAPYIFIINDDIDVMEATLLSRKASKMSIGNFIVLILSFTGWLLLSFLAVPLIFTVPYALMCYTVHAEATIALYNKKINAKEFFVEENEFDL